MSNTERTERTERIDAREALRRLVNYLEADPDLYEGDDDGTLRRLMYQVHDAMLENQDVESQADRPASLAEAAVDGENLEVTDEDRQVAYQAGGREYCPYCENSQLSFGSVSFEGDYVFQDISCNDCSKEWRDSYEFKEFVPASARGVESQHTDPENDEEADDVPLDCDCPLCKMMAEGGSEDLPKLASPSKFEYRAPPGLIRDAYGDMVDCESTMRTNWTGSYHEMLENFVLRPDLFTRGDFLMWLTWNDRNGCYSDHDCQNEGIDPLTHKTAWELLRDQYERDAS